MRLAEHVLFFLVLALAIVVMGAFFTEPEDEPALRSLPRRYGVFVGACALVAGVMLVFERVFLSLA
jgi:hypothetical protein